MYTAARKIHLIEQVLQVNSEKVLVELENVLHKSQKAVSNRATTSSIYDFVGILSKKEADQMRQAIEETCEIINPDDWK